VLDGGRGGPRDAVLANAAAALYVAGVVGSIVEGVDVARASLDSGRAARLLERLVEFTGSLPEGGR
jgi:anthranilate phosphoribosyltransferase